MGKTKKHSYGSPEHWDNIFKREFAKESDRAAVILTTSLFEHSLESLLRNRLVAVAAPSDCLFDDPNAPLSSFSAKINKAYRMGLISTKFARDLHLIRKIRNCFAHNINGCTFDDASVRSRILELAKSSQMVEKNAKMRKNNFPDGPRGDFELIASWMLYSINHSIDNVKSIDEADIEWGYEPLAREDILKSLKDRGIIGKSNENRNE